MHIHLIASALLTTLSCTHAIPVTITGSGADSASPSTIVEADGTDIVVGDASNANVPPGETIFVPGAGGETVIPITDEPSVLAPGGIPVTVTGGADGVVVVPDDGAGPVGGSRA